MQVARMPKSVMPSDIAEYLRYEPETGELFWAKASGHARVGDRAGSMHAVTGYFNVRFRRKVYGVHRVAFMIMTGTVPDSVDHRDGDPTNNRWANLRAATPTQQNANRRGHGKLKKGVRRDGNRFAAQLCRRHLGMFETEDEAHEAYVAAARAMFGDFARAA